MVSESEARATLRRFENRLLRNPNVTKVSVVRGTGRSRQLRLEVGVKDMRLHRRMRAKANAQPFIEVIPSRLPIGAGGKAKRQIGVRVIETGTIRPLGVRTAHADDPKAIYRPAIGGISIGNIRYNNAGTLGYAVMGKDGKTYLLSNWHVLAGPLGKVGDDIFQPGRLDGGTVLDKVATLSKAVIDGEVDAAIALVDNPPEQNIVGGLIQSWKWFKKHHKVKPKRPGMWMYYKCGRTSARTKAIWVSLEATVKVEYDDLTRVFRKQIETKRMLSPGDSGSVVWADSNAPAFYPAGLGFAGGSTRSYHNPLVSVFSRLGLAHLVRLNSSTQVKRPRPGKSRMKRVA